MNKTKLFSVLLTFTLSLSIISCSPPITTTGVWLNKEKLPPEPIKSVFIIAFTDNMELRKHLENDLAAAAETRGIKPYKSLDIVGPVDIKLIAPVKDVFLKKLHDINCETVFTVALVDQRSDTKYVQSSTTVYSPYSYGPYGGYGGYGISSAYGGFGGYYSYAASTITTPGYYVTDNKYFLEAKMFDLKTDELLLSIQSKADNPSGLEKSSKLYTQTLMDEIKLLNLRKK